MTLKTGKNPRGSRVRESVIGGGESKNLSLFLT
jgi:hypothetical protein